MSAFAILTAVGCIGPGLEPPDGDGRANNSGTSGVGGAAGVTGLPMAGAAGMAGGSAGTGGVAGTSGATGGAGGTGQPPLSGSGGEQSMAGVGGTMASGGVGGEGGAAGAGTSGDGGMDPDASMDCETGRESVTVDVVNTLDSHMCTITLSETATIHAPSDISLAVQIEGEAPMFFAKGDDTDKCAQPDGNDFFFLPSLTFFVPPPNPAATQIRLCPELCESVAGVDSNATVAVVFGCTESVAP